MGVQYNLRPAFRVGAVARTPGLLLLKDGAYTQEGLSTFATTKTTASFYEPSGKVTLKVPLELKFGAAWIGRPGQIEVDVLSYLGAGTYTAFQSSQTMRVVTDQGDGHPSVQELAFVEPVVDSRAVVNVAVGGQLNLAQDGRWRLHGGFATDRSPVGQADTLFNKVNMQVWTVGVSGKTQSLLVSVGVRYEAGWSALTALHRLQTGGEVTTRFKISSLGLVYSVALLL